MAGVSVTNKLVGVNYSKQPQGEYIEKDDTDYLLDLKCNGTNRLKDYMQTVKGVSSLVDGKDADGISTISAEKFKAYCHEHFPHADLTNVDNITNYITVLDAICSLTSYYVQEQTELQRIKITQLKEELGTPVQEQPPQMGL